MSDTSRRRNFWGWGYDGESAEPSAIAFAEAALGALLGGGPRSRREPPREADLRLRPPRLKAPSALDEIVSITPRDRAFHTYGRSYRDLARAVRGAFDHPPDLVAYPRTEEEIVQVLEHCERERVAVIPFGGGTSVAGGVEPVVGDVHRGTLSLDLCKLDRVLEIDETGRAARVQAGVLGPSLEDQLRSSGLTLRHFPQSFEMSTLGGWIATRAGGHFATLYTHIDDLVQAMRVVTPRGVVETRRLPGSGAGPQPERLFIGSEGALGVITEAWMRLFARPTFRASATVRFPSFQVGARAARAIAQSGLYPSNCRLLDPAEVMMSGAGPGDGALLLLAFESADHSVEPWIRRAVELARQEGGAIDEDKVRSSHDVAGGRDATADTYKAAFFRAPYLRDELVLRGVFVETFETAVPWHGLDRLDAAVREAVARLPLGPSLLACRLTHVYPDGCAPYYTVIAAAPEQDGGVALWRDTKHAITDAVIASGGTSTHHHAVGRDVVPYWERERPALFGEALAAAKQAVDPGWIMNPGVLLRAPSTTTT